MDPLQVSLRILHIVFGLFFVGNIFFLTLFLEPRLKTLGPSVQSPVMGALMPILMPAQMISFIVMFGTGVALTLILRWGGFDTFFASGWGWAMLISGALTVVLGIVGFGFITPAGRRMERLGRSIQGRPPTPDEAGQLSHLSERLTMLSRANFVLGLVIVGFMAAARYV